MGYKVGDTVWLVGEITSKSESDSLIDFVNGKRIWFQDYCLMDAEKTYSDGLNDAWELVRKTYNLSCNILEEIYGVDGGFYELMKKYTPQEALKILEAYEESKAIKVGDVVKHIHAEKQYEFVVTTLNGMGVQGIGSDGNIFMVSQKEVEKTGRHIDISSLLEQIRGDD